MTTQSTARIGSIIFAAQLSVALLGVVALRLYTGLVPPDVFGASNLLLSALSLGLQLFAAGVTAAQLRYFSEAEAIGAGDDFTRATAIWALRATAKLSGAIVLLYLVARLIGVTKYSAALAGSGIIWLFAMSVRQVFMGRIQAERRQALYARLQVLETILVMAATIVALWLAPTVVAFLLGQAIGIVLLLGVIFTRHCNARMVFTARAMTDSGLLSKARSYGTPFATMAVFSWFANQGDRYTLAALLGAEATGRYIAPFSIASRCLTLTSSGLSDLFRPILFDAENRCQRDYAHSVFVKWIVCSILISLVAVFALYCGGRLLADWLLAPSYRPGSLGVMLWVVSGYGVFGVTQVLENRLLSLGRSARLLLPQVVGAIANITLSIILIHRNGMIGAAQATFGSFVLQVVATAAMLLHALAMRRRHSEEETQVEVA
jgi:O-antigen/teichoic acid export membrane protein